MKKWQGLILLVVASIFTWVWASDDMAEQLAQASTDRCKATSNVSPTVQMIMEKVDAGAKLVEAEGEAAFAKFKGQDSDFIFAGTYIWIHTPTNTKMLMHPIKYKMEGKELGHLRDKNGKAFFAEMNNICLEKGCGWVQYVWPKPGESSVSNKVSYVKLATHNGQQYVLGCGVYDLTLEDVQGQLGH